MIIHTSLVSQVFQGEKNLTFEQACDLCRFFGLTELESDYLIALVDLVERSVNTVDQSKPEAMYCLNIDWFKLTS